MKFRVVLVAMLAAAMLAVAAPGAHASAPAASKAKFCKAVRAFSNASDLGSSDPTKAKALANQMRKAGKLASAKVRVALNVMAKYLDAVADQDAEAIGDSTNKFSNAVTTFATYYAQTCAGYSLPKS